MTTPNKIKNKIIGLFKSETTTPINKLEDVVDVVEDVEEIMELAYRGVDDTTPITPKPLSFESLTTKHQPQQLSDNQLLIKFKESFLKYCHRNEIKRSTYEITQITNVRLTFTIFSTKTTKLLGIRGRQISEIVSFIQNDFYRSNLFVSDVNNKYSKIKVIVIADKMWDVKKPSNSKQINKSSKNSKPKIVK